MNCIGILSYLAQGSSGAIAVVRIRFPTPVCGREVVVRSRLVVFFGPANVLGLSTYLTYWCE